LPAWLFDRLERCRLPSGFTLSGKLQISPYNPRNFGAKHNIILMTDFVEISEIQIIERVFLFQVVCEYSECFSFFHGFDLDVSETRFPFQKSRSPNNASRAGSQTETNLDSAKILFSFSDGVADDPDGRKGNDFG
jgi:hypothetical protein